MALKTNKEKWVETDPFIHQPLYKGDLLMAPTWWQNKGSSIVYLQCYVEQKYPEIYTPPEYRVIIVKPGYPVFLPHQYYKAFTRDDTLIKSRTLQGGKALDA